MQILKTFSIFKIKIDQLYCLTAWLEQRRQKMQLVSRQFVVIGDRRIGSTATSIGAGRCGPVLLPLPIRKVKLKAFMPLT